MQESITGLTESDTQPFTSIITPTLNLGPQIITTTTKAKAL